MKLFHTNLTLAKRLAASHLNPMSDSLIFIMKIHIVCCLPLDFFVCLRKYWSAILAGVSSERRKRWPSQLTSFLVITWDNSQQPSLERIYRVFECFDSVQVSQLYKNMLLTEQFKEWTFTLMLMSPKKISFIEFTTFIASTFLPFTSSSVSSNIPKSLHFFHVSSLFLLKVH